MNKSKEFTDKLIVFSKNPSSIIQGSLDLLESVLDGNDVVDATSPFMFLLENCAVVTASAIASGESVTRSLYPVLAQSEDELYHHMTDTDFKDRFSLPSKVDITVWLPLNQLIANSVPNDNGLGSHLTLPVDTRVHYNDLTFSLNYPIRISLLAHGNIQCTYDLTIESPLEKLASNIVESAKLEYLNESYLELILPMWQFAIDSITYTLSGLTNFKNTLHFKDDFYTARVYLDFGDNIWKEIRTTYSTKVYDRTVPTATLTVLKDSVIVKLPDIYHSTDQVGLAIRVDVYTTKGALSDDLSMVSKSDFSATWSNIDSYASNDALAPVDSNSDMVIYSTDTLKGGRNKLTLEELREKIIYRVGSRNAPIRRGDIEIGLKELGYSVQLIRDNVSDRVYLASKDLPKRLRDGLETPILATNTNVIFDIGKGLSNLTHKKSIIYNTNRSTITSNAVYKYENGNVTYLSDLELDILDNLSVSDRGDFLNNGSYMYSPFHYVVYRTDVTIKTKGYYLGKPVVSKTNVIAVNNKETVSISTTYIDITLKDNVIKIRLTGTLTATASNLQCQLRYRDSKLGLISYLDGDVTVTGNAVTTIFTLNSTMDITEKDYIETHSMSNLAGDLLSVYVPLELSVDVFYFMDGDSTNRSTLFDTSFRSNGGVVALTYENVTFKIGTSLDHLYIPSRDILGTVEYEKYTEDEPATYKEDVYLNNDIGHEFVENNDGTVTFTKLHSSGDVMHDPDGLVLYNHVVGDLILDVNGNGIPVTNPVINKEIGITMFSAMYNYATSDTSVLYRDSIPENVIKYLENDIAKSAGNLHERTELYYKPKGTLDKVTVRLGGGTETVIENSLSFSIVYLLTSEGFNNTEIRSTLNIITRSIISEHITNSTISLSELSAELSEINKNVVKGIDIKRFGDDEFSLVKLLDNSTAFNIPEVVVMLPDGTLDVTDGVDISFKLIE